MKLAVVGPVEPFRSGIARHTTALARALAASEGCSVEIVSFSRQYPAFLYPGEAQREAGSLPPADLGPRYLIDSLAPWTWHKAARELAAARPDAAIIPAWTFFVAPALGTVARRLRASGVPVIALVHNATDHEPARWKHALSAWQLAPASHAVAHAEAVAQSIARVAPGLATSVYPHPLYDDHPPPARALPRRARVELLFFGVIRPYKGVTLLLEALERTDSEVFLTIAGEEWGTRGALQKEIAQRGLAGRVELIPRFVPDQDAADLFARCDVVVAPYHSATGSGVVALAHHYGKPVLGSDIPALREVIAPGETGWLFEAGNPAALVWMIESIASGAAIAAMAPHLAGLRDRRSWAGLAGKIIELARGLASDLPP